MISSTKNYLLGILIMLCGFTTVSNAQDGASMIPGDAVMVFDLNLKKITGKINYKMVEDMFWVNRADYEVQRDFRYKENGEYEKVSNFYKNPSASGIDTTGHMYWFMKIAKRSETIGFIIPISNRAKFQAAFDALANKRSGREIKTYGNVKYYSSGRRVYLYTEKHFMYLEIPYSEYDPYSEYSYDTYNQDIYASPADSTASPIDQQPREERYDAFIKGKIDAYVNMPTSQSLAGNADFKAFKLRDCDAGFWANFDIFSSDEFKENRPEYANILSAATKGTYFHYYGFLNKGEIAIEFETMMNKDLSARAAKMYTNTFNPALLNYFKKDSLVAFGSANVNMHELNAYMKSEGQSTPASLMLSEMMKDLFRREINNDPEMEALRARMDSLREIAYGYSYSYNYNDDYNYGDYSSEEVYDYEGYDISAPAPIAVDTVAIAYDYDDVGSGDYSYEKSYDEEEYDSDKGKNKKNKKDKVKKAKKAKAKKGEETPEEYGDYVGDYDDYNYDYDYGYDDKPYYTQEQKDSAETLLWSLYEAEDSLEAAIIKRYLADAGITEDDIWHFFRGDMAGGITRLYVKETKYISYDYDENMNFVEVEKTKKSTAVEYIVAATVDRKEKLVKFLDLLESKGVLLKDGNMYRLVYSPDKLNHYFYIRDNIFFVTNRQHLAITQPQGYGAASLSSDATYKSAASSNIFFINSDIVKITDFMATQIERKEEKEMTKSFGRYMSSASLTSSYTSGNKVNAKMRVAMKNTSTNSILEIFKLIERLYLVEEVY